MSKIHDNENKHSPKSNLSFLLTGLSYGNYHLLSLSQSIFFTARFLIFACAHILGRTAILIRS